MTEKFKNKLTAHCSLILWVFAVTFIMVSLLPAKIAMAGEIISAEYDNNSGNIEIMFCLDYSQYVNVYAYIEGEKIQLLQDTLVTGTHINKDYFPYRATCHPEGEDILYYINHDDYKDEENTGSIIDMAINDYSQTFAKRSMSPSCRAGVTITEKEGSYAIITWKAKDLLTDATTGKLKDNPEVLLEIEPLGFPDRNDARGITEIDKHITYSRCPYDICPIWSAGEPTGKIFKEWEFRGNRKVFARYTDGTKGLFNDRTDAIVALADVSKCLCLKNAEGHHITEEGTICRNWTWTATPLFIMRGEVMIIPEIIGEFELDYNILERKVRFDLGTSSASLSFPRIGELTRNFKWVSGSGEGSLGIRNDTPEIFGETFYAENASIWGKNPPAISVSPTVHTLLARKNYGDYPLDRIYGVSKEMIGQVSSGGNEDADPGGAASGDFTYEHGVIVGYNEETGAPIIVWYPEDGSASGPFGLRAYRKSIAHKVYNGLSSASLDYRAMSSTLLKKEIRYNSNSRDFINELFWVSMNKPDDPITFDIVRLMYNQEENDSLTNETVVPGRYQRYFKWQDSSILTARVVNGEDFQSQYEQDRREARNLNYDYIPQKAAFAPDLIYKDIPYPIRSGYYFNPAGRYEFTIETTIYKDSNDRTQEHEDLVNAMIRAFRYESDMVYIDPLSEAAVSINGTYVEKMGTTYGPVTNKSANNIGINDYTEFLGTDFFDVFIKPDPINVVEVHHSGYPSYIVGSGYDAIALEQSAHESFRRNMEGYAGSGTSENRYTYKYVEYVERSVKIYEVREKTTVTITINPNNNRVYTHPQMRNGKYYIRAYIGEVELSALTYGQLANINKGGGTFTLDDLEIDVIGSSTDVSVSGRIKSYNPDNPIFIQLYKQYSDDVYTTTIDSDTGSGQVEQEFRFAGVAPGIYDLVITKDAHTKFTVKNVFVDDEDLDLTLDKRPEVQLMTLRCGDINGDGLINDADLTILWRAGNYNKKAVEAENSRCDLNGDGLINDADLTILWLAYNYNRGAIIID